MNLSKLRYLFFLLLFFSNLSFSSPPFIPSCPGGSTGLTGCNYSGSTSAVTAACSSPRSPYKTACGAWQCGSGCTCPAGTTLATTGSSIGTCVCPSGTVWYQGGAAPSAGACGPPSCPAGQQINVVASGSSYSATCQDIPPPTDPDDPDDKCDTGDAGVQTFSPNQNISCIGQCQVSQSGDSYCTGTAASGGSCTASFSYTGAECPGDGDDGGDSSSSAANSSGGSGSSSGNNSSGGSGSSSGGGSGSSSGGSNSSSGSGSGGDDGGGDSDGGSTGDGSGGSTGGGSGSSSGSGSGSSSGTASSSGSGTASSASGNATSGNCKNKPTCTGDAIQCAILLQSWTNTCDGIDKVKEPDVDKDNADIDTKFNELKTQAEGEADTKDDGSLNGIDKTFDFTQITQKLDDLVNTSSGASGTCPAPAAINLHFAGSQELEYQPLCDFAERSSPILVFIFSIIAAIIVLRSVVGGE